MMTRRSLLATTAALPLLAKAKLDRSRLSVMTDEVGRDLADAIQFAKGYRLQWVELRSPGKGDLYDLLPATQLKEVSKQIRDSGLRVSFLNSGLLKFTIPGTSPIKTEASYENAYKAHGWTPESMWKDRASSLRRCLDAAQILGTKYVRSFSFWRVADPASARGKLVETLHEMAEIAAKDKCKVLVENEFACNMASSEETAEILKLVDHPGLGLNWDPQNSTSFDTDGVYPAGLKLIPKKRIVNVQMKAQGLLGPEKKLDWAGIVRDLEAGGYTGLYGLETHTLKGPAINIPASHECVKEMLRLVGDTA